METRKEDKALHHRGCWLCDNGAHDLPDHGHGCNDTKDMGPIRNLGPVEGTYFKQLSRAEVDPA